MCGLLDGSQGDLPEQAVHYDQRMHQLQMRLQGQSAGTLQQITHPLPGT